MVDIEKGQVITVYVGETKLTVVRGLLCLKEIQFYCMINSTYAILMDKLILSHQNIKIKYILLRNGSKATHKKHLRIKIACLQII